jgi:hypothetical protein
VRTSQAKMLQSEKALLLCQLSALRDEREEARADDQRRRAEWEEHMATMAQAMDRQRGEAEATQQVICTTQMDPTPLHTLCSHPSFSLLIPLSSSPPRV